MALNATVKRHVNLLSQLWAKGEGGIYQILHGYIRDAAQQSLVVPEDAQEIYEAYLEYSGRPDYSNIDYKESNSYKTQVLKIKHSIEDGIDANHNDGE